jgi:citrate lyase subunit beta/citryl-CoA lyase
VNATLKTSQHPREVLQGAQAGAVVLPVCDHYCGVEARMRKSLRLQAEMQQEFGVCVFDVTLDCEDGAPVGGEVEHAQLVAELVQSADANARVAVRVHPVDHPSFHTDINEIVATVGQRLCHVMLPKVESLADIDTAVKAIDQAGAQGLAVHALIESPAAVHRAFDIAAHPRLQSLSFGLMDFVSAHAGAIASTGMDAEGQFSHPLVLRAKLDISSACHAHGKVPSHSVITEFDDTFAVENAARRASQELGYTRMWSIHPAQIRPILSAMSPSESDVEKACDVLLAAQRADWAPISIRGKLLDRASYRYFWQLLQRAKATGRRLPAEAQVFFE